MRDGHFCQSSPLWKCLLNSCQGNSRDSAGREVQWSHRPLQKGRTACRCCAQGLSCLWPFPLAARYSCDRRGEVLLSPSTSQLLHLEEEKRVFLLTVAKIKSLIAFSLRHLVKKRKLSWPSAHVIGCSQVVCKCMLFPQVMGMTNILPRCFFKKSHSILQIPPPQQCIKFPGSGGLTCWINT